MGGGERYSKGLSARQMTKKIKVSEEKKKNVSGQKVKWV